MKRTHTAKSIFADKHRCIAIVDAHLSTRIDSAHRMATEALKRLDALEPHVTRPGRPRVSAKVRG